MTKFILKIQYFVNITLSAALDKHFSPSIIYTGNINLGHKYKISPHLCSMFSVKKKKCEYIAIWSQNTENGNKASYL